MKVLLLLLSIASISGSTPTAHTVSASTTLTKILFPFAEERHALCNDGSSAGYYASFNSSSKDWVIHLQGGYWCWDESSCLLREREDNPLISSTQWSENVTLGGIFSSNVDENPDFAFANKVMVSYCSSDAWIGNTIPTNNSIGWYFQGRNILNVLIQDLTLYYHFQIANRVFFTGCSAGGQGVLLNTDLMHLLVTTYAPQAIFFAFADAGWLIEVEPFTDSILPLSKQLQQGLALWGGENQLNSRCAQSNLMEPWVCLFSSIAIQYINTPVLIQASQFDTFQIEYNIGHPLPYNSTEQNYIQAFRKTMQRSFEVFPSSPTLDNGLYSPACFSHCISLDSTFTLIPIPYSNSTLTLQQTINLWMNKPNTSWIVVDNCSTFNCTSGCPPS